MAVEVKRQALLGGEHAAHSLLVVRIGGECQCVFRRRSHFGNPTDPILCFITYCCDDINMEAMEHFVGDCDDCELCKVKPVLIGPKIVRNLLRSHLRRTSVQANLYTGFHGIDDEKGEIDPPSLLSVRAEKDGASYELDTIVEMFLHNNFN